jgi:hypothetical protein
MAAMLSGVVADVAAAVSNGSGRQDSTPWTSLEPQDWSWMGTVLELTV